MTIEGRCKTCRSWKADKYRSDSQGSTCKHPKLSPDNDPLPLDGAMDSEEYAGIFTGPEFGCIHYTKKEGTEDG